MTLRNGNTYIDFPSSEDDLVYDLDALFGLMRDDDPVCGDWTDLPVFGGNFPACGNRLEACSRLDVWSWDTDNVIVGLSSDSIMLVSREELAG